MIFRRLFGSRTPGTDALPSVAHYDTPEEGDRLIIEQLRGMSADLSKPREVLHYLYLPSREAAEAARDELTPLGYAVDVRPAAGPPGPNPWLCLATTEAIVSVDSARASREAFTALATTHGGEYDGWEAAGTP
jgi:hypothetical protein